MTVACLWKTLNFLWGCGIFQSHCCSGQENDGAATLLIRAAFLCCTVLLPQSHKKKERVHTQLCVCFLCREVNPWRRNFDWTAGSRQSFTSSLCHWLVFHDSDTNNYKNQCTLIFGNKITSILLEIFWTIMSCFGMRLFSVTQNLIDSCWEIMRGVCLGAFECGCKHELFLRVQQQLTFVPAAQSSFVAAWFDWMRRWSSRFDWHTRWNGITVSLLRKASVFR